MTEPTHRPPIIGGRFANHAGWTKHAACVVLAATAIASATAAPGAATSGGRLREYQPGVAIDWDNGAVHVDTRVVLRQGQLEFLACFHSKDHESILRCEARAAAVFQAMGLAGMTPGHPPRWNDVTGGFDAPTGDLVDILLRWDGVAQTHTINACNWLRTIEFGRAPIERPWVFGGSILLEDGLVASEYSGVGVATVDFVDSLIAYSRRYPSILGGVWVTGRHRRYPRRRHARHHDHPAGTAASSRSGAGLSWRDYH